MQKEKRPGKKLKQSRRNAHVAHLNTNERSVTKEWGFGCKTQRWYVRFDEKPRTAARCKSCTRRMCKKRSAGTWFYCLFRFECINIWKGKWLWCANAPQTTECGDTFPVTRTVRQHCRWNRIPALKIVKKTAHKWVNAVVTQRRQIKTSSLCHRSSQFRSGARWRRWHYFRNGKF